MDALEGFMGFFLVTLPGWVLLLTGAFVVVVSVLYPFVPFSERGVVVGLGLAPSNKQAKKGCKHNQCGTGVCLQVKLSTGVSIVAEASPCSACMERFKPGDPVRILRLGGRCVAQKIPFWMSGRC